MPSSTSALNEMTPSGEIHLSVVAVPWAVHTAAVVPLHWQQKVQADLIRDAALEVIEKVPYFKLVTWCHRMVLTKKHDGTPRRTVNLSLTEQILSAKNICYGEPVQPGSSDST